MPASDPRTHVTTIPVDHSTGRPPPAVEAIRVLVVDDHPSVRDALVGLLPVLGGIQVVGAAADGAEGLTMCRMLAPDVVVMDLSMPVVDGVEATRRITAECPASRVVVFSAHPDSTRVGLALEAGAVGYVPKDASIVALADALRAAAGQSGPAGTSTRSG